MNKKKLLAGPYLFWALAFILIPLAMIVYYGLTDANGPLTFENLLAIGTVENFKALCLSLLLSLISTAICLLLAYPLAIILSNMKVGQNGFIVLIFIIPMWMNFLLRTLAWQTLLEKNGVINQVLHFFHLRLFWVWFTTFYRLWFFRFTTFSPKLTKMSFLPQET